MPAHSEIVRERLSNSYGTLSATWYTVHFCGPILVKAMEVQTCGSIAQIIVEIHNDAVSHSHGDLWDWPLAVNTYNRAWLYSIRIGSDP